MLYALAGYCFHVIEISTKLSLYRESHPSRVWPDMLVWVDSRAMTLRQLFRRTTRIHP